MENEEEEEENGGKSEHLLPRKGKTRRIIIEIVLRLICFFFSFVNRGDILLKVWL